MTEQDRLQIDLIDPVRRLRRRPPCIGAARGAVAGGAAGNLDPAELNARRGCPVGAVVGEVRGQAGIAQLRRHAEPAEYLHRARRDVVALDAGRIAGMTDLGNHDINAA